jgi:SAM-dependent methyltransferase
VSPALGRVRIAGRYATNLVAMVAKERGYPAAAAAGGRFLVSEARSIPRLARLSWQARSHPEVVGSHPPMYSEAILGSLTGLGVEVTSYPVDVHAFRQHVIECGYPRNYAAGPMDEGGMREQKLLEYFVSLDLLNARRGDVVIDIASEWSIFPDVLADLSGAEVYRQDLIYPPGIEGHRIGGSASSMPVPDGFADRLVLHNAFEHFEGSADVDFIRESWRVLKPGGILCILPLFLSEDHVILTDPLVDRRGVLWDEGARVVQLPWWHNRFGRFYDAEALRSRVLEPGARFRTTIYRIPNVREVHPRAYLHFALVMRKPDGPPP